MPNKDKLKQRDQIGEQSATFAFTLQTQTLQRLESTRQMCQISKADFPAIFFRICNFDIYQDRCARYQKQISLLYFFVFVTLISPWYHLLSDSTLSIMIIVTVRFVCRLS